MNIHVGGKVEAGEVEGDVATLTRDGIVGKKGAFSRDFASLMARARPTTQLELVPAR